MAIRRLKVSNFRSFNELDVELGDFNVLIGANASGKSNFIEIFRFLARHPQGLGFAQCSSRCKAAVGYVSKTSE